MRGALIFRTDRPENPLIPDFLIFEQSSNSGFTWNAGDGIMPASLEP